MQPQWHFGGKGKGLLLKKFEPASIVQGSEGKEEPQYPGVGAPLPLSCPPPHQDASPSTSPPTHDTATFIPRGLHSAFSSY